MSHTVTFKSCSSSWSKFYSMLWIILSQKLPRSLPWNNQMGSVLYKSCKRKIESCFSFLFIGLIFKPLGVSRSRIQVSAGNFWTPSFHLSVTSGQYEMDRNVSVWFCSFSFPGIFWVSWLFNWAQIAVHKDTLPWFLICWLSCPLISN